jgi:3-hydroxyisobutyrate dehydrogenase-like beta-hydroxyacid dehydrogenase
MAVGADHVGAVLGHMHIEFARRILQRGIEVAVLDRIAAAAAEVAGAAIGAAGFADMLGDLGQVGALNIFLPGGPSIGSNSRSA